MLSEKVQKCKKNKEQNKKRIGSFKQKNLLIVRQNDYQENLIYFLIVYLNIEPRKIFFK